MMCLKESKDQQHATMSLVTYMEYVDWKFQQMEREGHNKAE